MAKRFGVVVPFTGTIYIEVECEDGEDPIDAALNSDDLNLSNADNWSPHRHVCQGNVFYGEQCDAEIVEEFEEDDE